MKRIVTSALVALLIAGAALPATAQTASQTTKFHLWKHEKVEKKQIASTYEGRVETTGARAKVEVPPLDDYTFEVFGTGTDLDPVGGG